MNPELEQENWTDLHSDFVKQPLNWGGKSRTYQEYWQNQDITSKQAQKYLIQGFEIADFMFLVWLRDNKKLLIENLN